MIGLQKKLVLVGMALVSSLSFAAGRGEALRASSQLSMTTYKLSRYTRWRGYPNTTRTLRKIANLADDVEMEARFGSRYRAGALVNQIIRTYVHGRRYFNNIPSDYDRQVIQFRVRRGINRLAYAVFDSYAACAVEGVHSYRYGMQGQNDMTEGQVFSEFSESGGEHQTYTREAVRDEFDLGEFDQNDGQDMGGDMDDDFDGDGGFGGGGMGGGDGW